MTTRILSSFAFCALAGCAASRPLPEPSLPYPPSKPAQGDIFHLPTGLKMSFDQAMEVISGARLIFIGESHDNVEAHAVELQVIRELQRRFPGQVAIGMEMFREPQQQALDRWVAGELNETEFLKASRWYRNWGSDFGYYREILSFAKDHRLDLLALNPPEELQRQVRREGLEKLPPEVKERLPQMGEPDPYQRELLRAIYGGHLKGPQAFDAFLRVQLLWEENMAQRIVEYLQSPRGQSKKMVILAGGFHVSYGFGVPKKVLRRSPMPYVILLPEALETPPEKRMNVTLPQIPLLPADFVWMVGYQDLGKPVQLGVTLSEVGGPVKVEAVAQGSPAQKAGLQPGDLILSIDGQALADSEDLVAHVRQKRPGERGSLIIRRAGTEQAIQVAF